MTRKFPFTEWLLLAFLLYAPVHGALQLFGRRRDVDFGEAFAYLTITNLGLINFLAICIFVPALLLHLYLSPRPIAHRRLLLAGAALFSLVALHPQQIHKYYIIAVQNTALVVLLLITQASSHRYPEKFRHLAKLGYPAYLLSYVIAMLWPLANAPTGGFLDNTFTVVRYTGWFEYPALVGFFSVIAGAWSAQLFCQNGKAGWPLRALYLAALCFSFYFIYISTHRTSLLGMLMLGLFGLPFAVRQRKWPAAIVYSLICIAAVGMNFFGVVGKKNAWLPNMGENESRLDSMLKAKNLEGLMRTSGRQYLYTYLLKESQSHILLGQGSGAASKTVWDSNIGFASGFGSEPHQEPLRVYFDHGLIGLALAILFCVFLLFEINLPVTLPFLAAWLGLGLTDNPLIHPVWLTIPICAAMISLGCQLRERNAA